MAKLITDQGPLELLEGETVLQALERAGREVVSGCRTGICTSCRIQAEGLPPAGAGGDLDPALQAEGWFLACRAVPTEDLTIRKPRKPQWKDATLLSVDTREGGVAVLKAAPPTGYSWKPGQHVQIRNADGAVRPYSIASTLRSGHLEWHVRMVPGGRVSPYLSALREGDVIAIGEAEGRSTYRAEEAEAPLLAIGAGTGLAPVLGVVRDAIERSHRGPVKLLFGVLEDRHLYLTRDLAALEAAHPALSVETWVQSEGATHGQVGDLTSAAKSAFSEHDDATIHLAGSPAFVTQTQRALFLAGAKLQKIHTDPFTPVRTPG